MMLSGIPLTYIFIGINVIIYFITMEKPAIMNRMLFITGKVLKNKEYDRLLFSGFIHGSFMHLLFNMLTLFYFGPYIEQQAIWPSGRVVFLTVFILGILGGNLYCLFMKKEQSDYAALGASGGVVGIVYAVIFLNPEIGLSLFFIPFYIPGWIFAIIFSIGSIILTQVKMEDGPRISHEGHLGGALAGALTMIFFAREIQYTEQMYFMAGSLAPIILAALIKWIKPELYYRR